MTPLEKHHWGVLTCKCRAFPRWCAATVGDPQPPRCCRPPRPAPGCLQRVTNDVKPRRESRGGKEPTEMHARDSPAVEAAAAASSGLGLEASATSLSTLRPNQQMAAIDESDALCNACAHITIRGGPGRASHLSQKPCRSAASCPASICPAASSLRVSERQGRAAETDDTGRTTAAQKRVNGRC